MLMHSINCGWHTWPSPSVASASSAACPVDDAASPPWSAPAAGRPCQTLLVKQGQQRCYSKVAAGPLYVALRLGVRQCRLRSSQGRAAEHPCWELASQHSRCRAPGNACCDGVCLRCAGAGSSPSASSAGLANISMSSSVSVSMHSLPCQLMDMASTLSSQASASLSEHRLSVLAPWKACSKESEGVVLGLCIEIEAILLVLSVEIVGVQQVHASLWASALQCPYRRPGGHGLTFSSRCCCCCSFWRDSLLRASPVLPSCRATTTQV